MSALVGPAGTGDSPGLRNSNSSKRLCRTMVGSSGATMRSSAASSSSTNRPNLPSASLTILPMTGRILSSSSLCRSVRQPAGAFCRDDVRIHTNPVQSAEKPAVLDLYAPVHDRLEAGLPRLGGGGLVADPELLPQHPGADGDRLLCDRHHILGLAKDVHDADLLRDIAQ